MAKYGGYLRTGSCLGDPETNAWNALKEKNIGLFLECINEVSDAEAARMDGEHWINRPIREDNDNTLLFRAMMDNLPDFVRELLRAGASANGFNLDLGLYPILVAAQGHHLESLKLLFKFDTNQADPNVRAKSNGKTALHTCVEKSFEDGLDFLLGIPKVDVNLKDMRNCPPLYYAVKLGNLSMTKKLIAHGADYKAVCFGRPIHPDLMADKLPGFDPKSLIKGRAPLANQTSHASFDKIGSILDQAAIDEEFDEKVYRDFLHYLPQLSNEEINRHEWSGLSLLQKAVATGLNPFVRAVLETPGAEPNAKTASAPIAPVLMAANQQKVEILQTLHFHKADFGAIARESQENILHVLLKRGDWTPEGEACIRYLLWTPSLEFSIREVVNRRDVLENTALHYAAQKWPQPIVRRLLEVGANIGMKNHWDETPIEKIHPQTLEGFLDECCIQSQGDVNHENFELTFDYSFLAPPMEDVPSASLGKTLEYEARGEDKVALPETQSLWYLGQSKEHRHLLKHPVVTSFLYLKWQRIRRYFNRNLRFYLLFVFVLTWYIFEEFGGQSLREPSSKSIPLWYTLYAIFSFFVMLFLLRDWTLDAKEYLQSQRLTNNNEDFRMKSDSPRVLSNVLWSNWIEVVFVVFMGSLLLVGSRYLWLYLSLLTLVLICREFFQVLVSLKRYLLSPENWIEVSMIVLIGLILGLDRSDFNWELKRHLSAIAIVLSWAELITLVGRHPKLTRYNVYVTMFYKVMGTFFFFLCWYLFFLVAFSMGFYIMLHKDGPNDTPGEGDYPFFNRPWLALVKTSTMFVGEIEFANIPVNLDSSLSPLSYMFFLAFVFLIVVVLMNLLNGLAVSDTGLIQEKAEIYTYISQVDTISYTESVLLGDPFDFLSNWPKLKIFLDIPSCSLCSYFYQNRLVQRLFHKITGGSGVLLFYNVLPSKRLRFKPNERTGSCGLLASKVMDQKIITSAKNVILRQRATIVEDHVAKLERKFDQRMDSLELKLDTLINKLCRL